MTLRAFVFPKIESVETWLDKYLKSPVSDDPLTSNTLIVPKHC